MADTEMRNWAIRWFVAGGALGALGIGLTVAFGMNGPIGGIAGIVCGVAILSIFFAIQSLRYHRADQR